MISDNSLYIKNFKKINNNKLKSMKNGFKEF